MAETKETVHSYDIIKQIGSGSFGVVYLVKIKDKETTNFNTKSEFLVMKQISLTKLDAKQRLDAQKEIVLLSTLTHPNIVSYRHSFENDIQQLHIIMDYCDGGDLYRKVTERKRTNAGLLDEHQLMQWFVQVCLALKHIHERKILHRDLKTQNIFACDGDKIVKLGDFGIARILDHTADLAATCIGTPYYLSPEVCQNRPYGTKTDVWALGCVFYELATFRHPFEGRHLTELLTKIVRGTFDPLPTVYSPKFRQLIAHMLKVNSNERPDVGALLQREYVYQHAVDFLKKMQRQDELAILEDLMKQKKSNLDSKNQSRQLGLTVNSVRRQTTSASMFRQKSAISASRKAYFEKKFKMYMQPAVRLAANRSRSAKSVILEEDEETVQQKPKAIIGEHHVPTDPVPPTSTFSEEASKLEATFSNDPALDPDATLTPSKINPCPISESTFVVKPLSTTLIKPKIKERKKWQVSVPHSPASGEFSGTTIFKKSLASKSTAVEPKIKPKIRNVASALPSIPGSVDDGWLVDESHVCELCGSLFVAGTQKRKGASLPKQCQACRLSKKQQPKLEIIDGKSIYEKIECLRQELERRLGLDKFAKVYQDVISSEKSEPVHHLAEELKSKLENLIFLEKAYFS